MLASGGFVRECDGSYRFNPARKLRLPYRIALKFGRVLPHTEVVMNTNYFKTFVTFSVVAGVLCAQAPAKQAVLMALGANSKQMTQYQWKQKITVVRKGTPLEPRIEELRFDAAGQMHRITLMQPEEKKMGRLKARKAAEIKEDVQEVMQLAGRYANPQHLSQAIQKSEIWQGQGTLRVNARAVILPIDEVTITVNSSNYLITRIDCKTQHEGSPVAIAIDYLQLPNGPSMMSRMTVQIPANDVVVNVEGFDFMRLGGPAGF